MLEFICRDRKATIRASNVLAVMPAFGLLPQVGSALLARHGVVFDKLDPNVGVPLQFWLNTIAEMQRMLGRDALRIAGQAAAKKAMLPPQISSLPFFLANMDACYYANHTGNAGHYIVRELPDGALQVRCETPYPAELEHGIVEGFTEKLCGAQRYEVDYQAGDGITHSCTITVRPLEKTAAPHGKKGAMHRS